MKNFTFSDVSSNFFSDEQISRIKNSRIGIAGAGGLGSNCAHALVRCGFEKLIIADFDIVSISNLNRQMYRPIHLGKIKVHCLADILQEINPEVTIDTFPYRIDQSNIHQVFDSCNIIVEAFDNPECKSMLIEEFWGTDRLLVAVSGIGGYGSSDCIITKKVHNNVYIIGDGLSEVGDLIKPFAPSVMIAASKQADVVLNWVLKDFQK